MELTIHEKRIIFQILIYIMKADSIEDPNEICFLDQVFHDFQFSISEFDHMELMDLDYLKRAFATFQEDKKIYAKKLFYDMAKCDGYVDPRELAIFEN